MPCLGAPPRILRRVIRSRSWTSCSGRTSGCGGHAALRDRAHPTAPGRRATSPDETGWKVGGQLYWLWAFATPDTTTHAIEDGRGFAQAARMLGADYPGGMKRDGWAPYRHFVHARPSDLCRASAPSVPHDDAGPSASPRWRSRCRRCSRPPSARVIAIATVSSPSTVSSSHAGSTSGVWATCWCDDPAASSTPDASPRTSPPN